MLLNRKLIIAVLTIGLMLSFSSAAIGYDDTNEKPGSPIWTTNTDAPLYNAEKPTIRHIPDFTKPSSALQPNTFTLDPSYTGPVRVCENLSYHGSIYYQWQTPDGYDADKWAVRMSPDNACTLRTVSVAVAQAFGTPGMTVEIFADAVGYPGALIATYDIPNSELPPPGYYSWITIEISATNAGGATYPDDFIFAEGDEFYVSGSTTGGGVLGTESLYFFSGDGSSASDHNYSHYSSGWLLMQDDWGTGYGFLMEADVCYENQGFPDDCYSISQWCSFYWLYSLGPGAGYQQDAYAVSYVPQGGEDSLTSIDLYLNDVIADDGSSIFDDPYTGSGNFPDLDIILCPPAGTGEPDIANATHTFTIDPENYVDWPTTFDVAAANGGVKPVFTSQFFVVFQINGGGTGVQEVQFVSDADDECPTYTSWGLYATGLGAPWLLLADLYGADNNLVVDVNMCKNIYTTCGWDYAIGGPAFYVGVPGFRDAGETVYLTGAAIRFDAAAAGCDVGELDMWFYSGATYAEDAEIAFYDDSGTDGLPGNRLQYIPMPNGSAYDYHDVAPNFFFETSFWLVVESFAENDDDLRLITDDGSTPTGRSAMKVELDGDPAEWYYYTDIFSSERNWYMGIYRCCYPFIVRTCAPDGDWPSYGKDFAKTQSTLNGYGDIQCNLTKSWTYENSSGGNISVAQPIIADGKIFAYMLDCLVCLDINTGTELWRRDNNYAEIAGSNRSTPTYKDGYLYCGGGENNFFAKFDAATGATLWSFSMAGAASFSPHVIVDIEGNDVIFVGDLSGYVYGVNASDGTDFFTGAATPTSYMKLDGQIWMGLATDGTNLYIGIDEYELAPNIYCFSIDAATPALVEEWNFVDDGDGFQLEALDDTWTNPETSQEGVRSAILYSDEGIDGKWLYVQTSYAPQNSSPHNGGVLYKISAEYPPTTAWYSETNGSGFGQYYGIVNDKAQVIFGGFSGWIGGAGDYAGPMAFAKSTGLPQWGPNADQPRWSIQTGGSQPDIYSDVLMPGILTCETIADPSTPDWFIFGNENGWWNFTDATAGEIIWHRRSLKWRVHLTSPIADEAGHIILGEGYNIHCMANATPRQRLHIAQLAPELPVPFGLPDDYTITFDDVLQNTGCADLTIFHVELLDADNGTFPVITSYNQSTLDKAENISAVTKKVIGTPDFEDATAEKAYAEGFRTVTRHSAAYALPAYINSLTSPTDGTIIPPGGSIPIVLNINGEEVPRGASSFYAEIQSDDPDYFLDSAYMDYGMDAAFPTVLLTVIGGCLYDHTVIQFGEDGTTNELSVWNSTFVHDPGGRDDGLTIEDNSSWLFGCDGLFYGDQVERLAMHATEGGSTPRWEGILPDPINSCDFEIAHDVVLAQLSNDGATYSNVLGTMINYAYVDSIEDHRAYSIDDEVTPPETTVTWEWDIEGQTGLNMPYSSELTEGFAFKGIVTEYAVTDVAGPPKYGFEDFWNFEISRHAVFSRYGYAIPGLWVGMVADWDIDENTDNMAGYSEEYSVSWMYEGSSVPYPRYGGGIVKIPFGPGYTPMVNSVEATTAWYGGEEPGFDSIYVWMTRPSTQFMNYQPYATGDRRLWSTVAELNLPSWPFTGSEDDPVPPEAFETFAYAFFGKYTDHTAAAVDNYSGMATLANQFCGFGRGDFNNDGMMNLVDIVYLNGFVHGGGNGPFPFMHLGDVNNDAAVDNLDITYMIDWYFSGGPGPVGDWALPQFIPTP